MPILPKKKVGLISCSGEELPEGTLSRVAALQVLERVRPNETVTLCLPLFLAGDDKERAFGRFYPTIAIDGCGKRCAALATEKYSAAPTASIVIPEFLAARGLAAPRARRHMDGADKAAVDALAQEIARQVDEILGVSPAPATEQSAAAVAESDAVTAACSCGSGIPVMRLKIAGKEREIVALPLILEESRKEGKPPEHVFDAVKVYNAIPADLESAYRDAIDRAYSAFVAPLEKPEA
ncbi:MAG: putative zinc-binding protein [Chloroflexi bacterium]|nr:putative zinc-binding protein [Chloroflexota bacterium]